MELLRVAPDLVALQDNAGPWVQNLNFECPDYANIPAVGTVQLFVLVVAMATAATYPGF